MSQQNPHLIEVNCAFSFIEETEEWNVTYFGEFYELIKDLGYVERQERKGVQITFSGSVEKGGLPVSSAQPLQDQVIFRNPKKGTAVLLGRGRVSFHCLQNYISWEEFIGEVVQPITAKYRELGLGNGKLQSSIVYLNRFDYPLEDDLSEYFRIVTPLDKTFGSEVSTSVQRMVSDGSNLLIAKLNKGVRGDIQTVNLECGSVCVNPKRMDDNDWIVQVNETHAPVRDFFNAIITEKLQKTLR